MKTINPLESKGFFDCLDALYQALATDKIDRIPAKNLPQDLKKLGCINVVLAEGLPQDQGQLGALRDTLYGGFYSQLDSHEHVDGLNFDYGIADLEGKKHFYFVWPETKPLDIKAIGQYLAKIKDMFRDTRSPNLGESDKVHLGPFDREDSLLFHKIYERLMTFNQQTTLTAGVVESSEGLKTSFNKAAYLRLFGKETKYSPIIRAGQTILPPAPHIH